MAGQYCEKVFSNCDIMVPIYKMLNFEDQLRLSNVNGTLANVFEICVWREDYRSLAIYGNGLLQYVVTSARGINRKCLSPQGFEEFLRHYAGRVRELNVNHSSLPDIKRFKQIISLRYKFEGEMQAEELQLMIENMPNLLSLCLNGSFASDQKEFIWLVKSLFKMKKLQRLYLNSTSRTAAMTYAYFRRIVKDLKLEILKLKFVIEPPEPFELAVDAARNSATDAVKLRELLINTTLDPLKWSSHFSGFLSTFENLLVLSVKFTDDVTDKILKILAYACKHVENLTIRHTRFAKVSLFLVPPKVTELSLYTCRKLTRDNLKQLLTQYRIVKFVSRLTFYDGPFEDFQISPYIQKLDVDHGDTREFKSAYQGNEHLKDLTWHHCSGRIHFRRIVTGTNLETCPNLETLDMTGCLLELDSLLQLRSLSTLKMRFANLPMQWSYIEALLKHVPLRDFLIDSHCSMLFRNMATDAPSEGFPTQVTSLKVHVAVFELALDFWLDLFCHNAFIKLVIFNFSTSKVMLLLSLVSHRKFPRSLKTIDIFGFNINCNDLRTNFEDTVKNLQPFSDEYTNMNRIILCRI